MRMNRRTLQLAACGGLSHVGVYPFRCRGAGCGGVIGMARKRSSDFFGETREDVVGRGGMPGGEISLQWGDEIEVERDFLKKWEG